MNVLIDLIEKGSGVDFGGVEGFLKTRERIFNLERMFNVKATQQWISVLVQQALFKHKQHDHHDHRQPDAYYCRYGFEVIVLCMSDDGMPETAYDRLKITDKLVNGLIRNNVKVENIFVDPLVQA